MMRRWCAFGVKRPARETVGESSCMHIMIVVMIFTMIVKSIAVSGMETFLQRVFHGQLSVLRCTDFFEKDFSSVRNVL